MTLNLRLCIKALCVNVCARARVRMRGRQAVIDLTHTRPALNTWAVATNTLTPPITALLEAQHVCVCVHGLLSNPCCFCSMEAH